MRGITGPITRSIAGAIAYGRAPMPEAPTGLTVTATSSSEITVQWTPGDGTATGFSLERSLNGVTGWTEIATPDHDQISYGDTGLDAETEYFYRIRAINVHGYSPYSNVDSDTTTA